MFKKSLLFMMLFVAFIGVTRATEVEIGDGTTAQYNVPIGTYYNYSITEQLYTADEIGMAGTINSISFNYASTAAKDFNITVYMANVDAADLSTGISLADLDDVFSGTISVTEAGWVTIDLDSPFAYDGTSNLLIGINKTGGSTWYSGNTWYGTAATNMARYTQQDSGAYTTGTTPGSVSSTRPNIIIDITPGSGPTCDKPDTFTLQEGSITANSAIFNWTGGSGSYNFEYKKSTDDEYLVYPTQATAFSLEGLEPGTTYNVRVQSVCSDGVSGYKTLSFTTLFGIPLVENFGTAIPTGWAMYNGLLADVLEDPTALTTTTYAWSFGTSNGVFDNHARVNIYGTSCMKWLVLPTITMEDNVQLQFDVAYTAYSGSGDPAQNGTDDKFVVVANIDGEWTILRQWDNADVKSEYVLNDLGTTPITVRLDLSAYAGQQVAIAFYGESTESNADNNLHIDNVSIDYKAACETPTSLAVNYEGGTTASVTWEDADACDIDVNGTVYENKTSPFEITGLEIGGIAYEVTIRQNCGAAGVSEWVTPVTIYTDLCMPEDMCQITFELEDSYGDGWNNAYLLAYDLLDPDEGTLLLLDAFTVPSGESSATYTLDVCDGRDVIFLWQSGSYDNECSYAVYDPQGDMIFSGSGGFDDEDYEYYFVACNTDCRTPSDFAASNIGGHEVTLSWTENGPATEWTIYYMASTDEETSSVVVTTNPYTFEGLDPLTTYYAMVVPTCDVWKESDVIHWTMDEACPKPHISVVPYPTSATVSWTGFADNYSFEWAEVPAEESKDGLWLQYDNSTFAGGIGNSNANTWTWGVMYPASMLEGNGLLSKVAIYETADYNTEDITINIYSGGDDAPGDLVYTETVTPEAADAFHEITLAETVIVDPTQNLWITLTEYGTYVLSYCQNGDNANNDWVLSGGTWAHVGDLSSSLAGDTWMIRGYVEPAFDPEELDWQPITGATSPVTLDNLTTETQYAVRIKALCGGDDGESSWATVTFWTPNACQTPKDLNAEPAARTADLSWTAYTDSYNLKYRYAEEADPTEPATIILEAHDVWEDQSGYQMLFDATATAYGRLWTENHYIMLVDGTQYSGGDIPSDYYDEFAYMIPEDADGSLTTTHIVMDGSVTITIPAGTYDYVILNPTPGDKFYIAADNGEVPCAGDDYVFEPGTTYHFTMGRFGTGDGAALEIERPMSDWITVENVTNPYTLTGLTPKTYHEWQVQGISCSASDNTEWSDIETFTTTEETTVNETIELVAGFNWITICVDITLQELEDAIVAALPGVSGIQIISQNDGFTTYNGRMWRGGLTSIDITKMYRIKLPDGTMCEIVLTGMPVDPAANPLTISPGVNWIVFPLNSSMSVTDAFAGYNAIQGDKLSSQDGFTSFNGRMWRGGLTTLEPGHGYIYNSKATTDQPLVYPTGSKKAAAAPTTTTGTFTLNKTVRAPKMNTVELDLVAPATDINQIFNQLRQNRLNVNIKK